MCGLWTAVVIGEALDIVFFEVIPVLNFNDLKRSFLRVLQPVFRIDGNIGAFVSVSQVGLPIPGHPGDARDNHPVFAPLPVELKAQLRFRF